MCASDLFVNRQGFLPGELSVLFSIQKCLHSAKLSNTSLAP